MRRLPIVFALCLLFWFTLSNNITASPFDPIVKTGLYKVLRGGSWLRDITDCRSSIRSMASAGERIGNVGFRLVRNLK